MTTMIRLPSENSATPQTTPLPKEQQKDNSPLSSVPVKTPASKTTEQDKHLISPPGTTFINDLEKTEGPPPRLCTTTNIVDAVKKNYVCRNISELYKQGAVVAALKKHPILEQDFSHSTWKSYSKYQKIALVKKLIVAFSKLNAAHLDNKQNNNLSKNGDFTKHVIEYINDSAAPTFLTHLQEYICKLEVLNDTDSKMGFHKIFPPEVLRCLKGTGDRLEKDAINPLNRKINFISNEHPFITTLNDTLLKNVEKKLIGIAKLYQSIIDTTDHDQLQKALNALTDPEKKLMSERLKHTDHFAYLTESSGYLLKQSATLSAPVRSELVNLLSA